MKKSFSGIYKILCLTTGKFYIGSSQNIKVRWQDHCRKLNKRSHSNSYLQRAWNKYGKENFVFSVLEKVPKKMLVEREQWWLDHTQCYKRHIGFNIRSSVTVPFPEKTERAQKTKKHLLRMAKNGCSRPTHATMYGQRLSAYTCESSSSFDYEFYTQAYAIKPEWFIRFIDAKQEELLVLAKSGAPKPRKPEQHDLAECLSRYILKSSTCYSQEFRDQLHMINPTWLIGRTRASEIKSKLIAMAKNGEPRPKKKTKLGARLRDYTNKNLAVYDKTFHYAIKNLRSDWLLTHANSIRHHLLAIAQSGGNKPTVKTDKKLTSYFYSYISKESRVYSRWFDIAVKSARPDWFLSTADNNRNLLLEMARRGNQKPNHKSNKKLLNCLNAYMSKSSTTYSEKFCKDMIRLVPHWFQSKKRKEYESDVC